MKRFESINSQCRSLSPITDIAYFVKYLSPLPSQPHSTHRLRMFMYPQAPNLDQDNIPGTSNSDYSSNAVSIKNIAIFRKTYQKLLLKNFKRNI